MPRERREPSRSTTRTPPAAHECDPIAFTRNRNASSATTPGSRRRRRSSGQSASPLGANTAQMNRASFDGDRRINQLTTLHELGLSTGPPTPSDCHGWQILRRVRQPGPTGAFLSPDELLALPRIQRRWRREYRPGLRSVSQRDQDGGRPTDPGDFQYRRAHIIAPGDPSRSVLYFRISKVGGGRIPASARTRLTCGRCG